MATENIKVLRIDTDPAQKSVKELRNELKQLKDTMVSCEKGTDEYNQALKQAAEIQHVLKEQMEELNATAMDFGQIAKNIVSATGGIVSGFQAAKATMNLFGVENEEVLKSLQKMQNLMAITQAMPGIEKGIKSLKNLVTVIANATTSTKAFGSAQKAASAAETASATSTKALQGAMVGEAAATNTATVATNTFKKALISTGIGAIVVLVGTLIANLERLAKWLGFGNTSLEQQKTELSNLTSEYNRFNSKVESTMSLLEGLQFNRKEELKLMDERIAKMKAEGATQAEILAQLEKDNERRKEMANEQISIIDSQEKSIEDSAKKLMKNLMPAIADYGLTVSNAYELIGTAAHDLALEEDKLRKLQEGDASEKDITKQKAKVEQYKQLQTIIQSYITLQNKEVEINNDIRDREKSVINERIANRKKLKEDLEKFDAQLLVDSKKNQEKELASVTKSENEKKKELEKFRKEGIISKKDYEERLNTITAIYADQRTQINYKYEKEASKKREEILKNNTSFYVQNLENDTKLQKRALDDESAALDIALRRREISFTQYYEGQIELSKAYYENEKNMVTERYNAESELIESQIRERQELLKFEGITDEEKDRILTEIEQLSQNMTNLASKYQMDLHDMTAVLNGEITLMNEATIQAQMDSLRMLTENVVNAMDAIAACGDGISTQWISAFDTMSNGLINLGQKIKEGTATWSDYGQMAVAAFSAAGSMMSALAEEQDATTKEGFEQQKKYQIAAATMNMLGGVTSAWVSAMNPANAWMTIWGQIAMGAATTAMVLATGIMQIQKIKQQQMNGAGGSTSTPNAGAVSSVIAPVQYTQDVQGASIEGAIKDTKVYVTESDITNTQNKVSVTENEARF